MRVICGFLYIISRFKLKRCNLACFLFSIIFTGFTVKYFFSNDCFINGKLSVYLDRGWYPPRTYRPDLDKYLIYKSELLPSLNQSSIILNKQCPSSSNYIVTVHSCIACDPERDTIRLTWAEQTLVRKLNVSVYFVVGTSYNKTDYSMTRLAAEDNMHKDIIQFDFIDAYHNLTIKTLAALNWASINCPSAKYVIKADQDLYYNLNVITNKLSTLTEKYLNSVMGFHFSSYDWLNHDVNSKKYLPEDVNDGIGLVPNYFYGWIGIYGRAVIKDIVEEAIELAPMLCLEDVFVTGFVSQLIDCDRYKLSQYYLLTPCSYGKNSVFGKAVIGDGCKIVDLVTIHQYLYP